MVRARVVSALLVSLSFAAFVSCGAKVSASPAVPVRAGETCEVRNSKAIGESGCDLCTCTDGHWSCSAQDCTCNGQEALDVGDGCSDCPCKDGKLQCTYCLTCPAPRTDLSCAPRHVWARDPESGVCCEYDKPCAASIGWTTHDGAAECNPFGCNCDKTTDGTRQPIGCACPLGGCPTLSQARSEPCGPDRIPIIEARGCGKVELSFSGGFSGWLSVFDERTGAMIGREVGSDQETGICSHFGYAFGEKFDCTDATQCARCAESTPDAVPACPH
jgi:hypothetical protein